MAGKKDAAWWRDYRARKAAQQQESKGLQDPGATPATPKLDTTGGHAVDRVDTSTAVEDRYRGGLADLTPTITGFPDGTFEFAAGAAVKSATSLTSAQRIAAGLAAPDDDCGACGHDRQMYHLGLEGRCTAAVGVKARCGCPAFVDPAEPF